MAWGISPCPSRWTVHRRINVEKLPQGRTVVQFDFSGARTGRFWLLLQSPKPDICEDDPGMPIDLYVAADAMAMTAVWMGRSRLEAAIDARTIDVIGPTALVAQFPGWLALNFFAPAARTSSLSA